ncbi:putative disease resistance protein RGA1 [Quercus suber]|uniref:putative disease resistance protein RGA1 n=1 Tax=Quercus suber TaxID=58331 RepID=UPI0032DF5192
MGSSCLVQLQNLSEGDSWSLFSQLAFLGRASEECEALEKIGRKIVSKCKGLPLAAKTLGSLMRFKRTKAEWQTVLDSEIWKLEEAEKGLFPPLLFSLYDLPSTIGRCFSFCAVFPKDYEIKTHVLIKLWMALGYLSSSRSREMEVTGQEYFECLAAHSLFQKFIKDDDVCDLCNLECLNLSWCHSLYRLPRGIGKLINLRHLELEETSSLTELPKGIGKLSSLRTLTKFIVSGDDNNEARNIEMLKNLKHLQGVLCLDGLGNIVSGVEAEKAELKHKEKLIGLTLEFFVQKIEEAMEDHVDDVIEALQPNPNLESLHVLYHQGTRLPSWIMMLMMLTNLRELILRNCEKCENLPPCGNLPSLELLK